MSAMDRAALVALFRATDGAKWKTSTNWNTDAELATWAGIKVNHEGRVVELILRNNNLNGSAKPTRQRMFALTICLTFGIKLPFDPSNCSTFKLL
ncbi:unnamed protein product [Ectocarpus sp. 6 AP-2014]